MSAIKVFATTKGIVDVEGVANYETSYNLSAPVLGVLDGTVFVPVGAMTETEANAAIQEAVRAHANLQTENVENFTVDDVRGGRI